MNHKFTPQILNRGFLFGEGLFTTIRFDGVKLLFWGDHLSRLKKGANFLFKIGEDHRLWNEIIEDIKTQISSFKQAKAIRISLFRETTNFKLFDDQGKVDFIIHFRDLVSSKNKRPFKIRSSLFIRQKTPRPSFLKTSQYLDSILELKEAKEAGFDDLLFISSENFITEASSSNIFSQKKGKVFTPKITNFILEGVTRKNLIECLKSNNIEVVEKDLTYSELLEMDQVWTTNSIIGMQLVDQIDDKKYEVFREGDSLFLKIEKHFKCFQDEMSL